jgi:nitroreductase
VKNWEEIFGNALPTTLAITRVGEEDLAKILEAAYVSDSDLVLFPYRIVVVAENHLIREAAIALSSDALLSCSLLLIIAIEKNKAVNDLYEAIRRIGSETNSRKHFERYEAPLSDSSTAATWVVGLAARCAARMNLAARALGHAAATLEIFASEDLRKIIAVADDVDLPFVVAVGGTLPQRVGQRPSESSEPRYFLNTWGKILAPKLVPEEVRYRDSLVSYFDILGFRSAIDSFSPPEIESVLIRMASLSYHDTRLRVVTRRGLSTFSDHVVRTVTLEGLDELQQAEVVEVELSEIRLVQANLAAMGRFLRGGITRGPVYIDDEFVFGPALVEAYDLENEVAKYPRIVLHNKLKPGLFNDEHLALQTNDGILMLNYLAAGDDVGERVGFVKLHAQIVMDALATATRPGVSEKLRWLVAFHNEVASKISEADLSEAEIARSDLIIEA